MGAERKSAHISQDNLRTTAYHEGGHALVALHTKGAMPIHKATIVPRGMALGMVSYLPEADQMNMSREQMLATLDVAMGGRIAEEIVFGAQQVTTGAQGDLAAATNLARSMVTRYGMSERLGPLYAPDEDSRHLAPATRDAIDKEVQAMLEVRRGSLRALFIPACPPRAAAKPDRPRALRPCARRRRPSARVRCSRRGSRSST